MVCESDSTFIVIYLCSRLIGTDICWSPYFPILSGICTEIGGLISHGAVVAREYGLPCIIGCSFATDIIQHGQKITLDADNGIITVA